MFSDAAGTVPVANGATVARRRASSGCDRRRSGRRRSPRPHPLRCRRATCTSTAGTSSGVTDAQRLILAQTDHAEHDGARPTASSSTPARDRHQDDRRARRRAPGRDRHHRHLRWDRARPDFVIPAGTTGTRDPALRQHLPTPVDLHDHRDGRRIQRVGHGRDRERLPDRHRAARHRARQRGRGAADHGHLRDDHDHHRRPTTTTTTDDHDRTDDHDHRPDDHARPRRPRPRPTPGPVPRGDDGPALEHRRPQLVAHGPRARDRPRWPSA